MQLQLQPPFLICENLICIDCQYCTLFCVIDLGQYCTLYTVHSVQYTVCMQLCWSVNYILLPLKDDICSHKGKTCTPSFVPLKPVCGLHTVRWGISEVCVSAYTMSIFELRPFWGMCGPWRIFNSPNVVFCIGGKSHLNIQQALHKKGVI